MRTGAFFYRVLQQPRGGRGGVAPLASQYIVKQISRAEKQERIAARLAHSCDSSHTRRTRCPNVVCPRVRAGLHISPHLPASPHISPYLPISPHISRYLATHESRPRAHTDRF